MLVIILIELCINLKCNDSFTWLTQLIRQEIKLVFWDMNDLPTLVRLDNNTLASDWCSVEVDSSLSFSMCNLVVASLNVYSIKQNKHQKISMYVFDGSGKGKWAVNIFCFAFALLLLDNFIFSICIS